jgi:hypothetical protein
MGSPNGRSTTFGYLLKLAAGLEVDPGELIKGLDLAKTRSR